MAGTTLILAISLLYAAYRGFHVGKYHAALSEPSLLVVKRVVEDGKTHPTELVAIIPLQEIPTLGIDGKLQLVPGAPTRYSIGAAGEKFSLMIVSPIRLSENSFRLNVFTSGEHFVFDNVEYNGEEYLTLAHGIDWHIAVSRRL
jgi:hypothetical protein